MWLLIELSGTVYARKYSEVQRLGQDVAAHVENGDTVVVTGSIEDGAGLFEVCKSDVVIVEE